MRPRSTPFAGTLQDSVGDVENIRRLFLAMNDFPLDNFQSDALAALDQGLSVLVAAPTGSGKTLVAEYAVARAISQRGRAFYTTPLKALSNQKYLDFVEVYGDDHVGLLTGDNSINPDAPVVVMTTEVLRNMIYAGPERLIDLRCVVLDEVHFLEDRYRGSVWEEIIITAPETTTLVCLSATVSNAEELARWISTVRGSIKTVIEEQRPIELNHLYVVGDRAEHEIKILPTFVGGKPNQEAIAIDRQVEQSIEGRYKQRHQRGRPTPKTKSRAFRPKRSEVIEEFARGRLLPAIYFIFARAGCEDAVRQCLDAGLRFTSPAERAEIREIADSYVDHLSDGDLKVLQYDRFRHGLEAGIAPHHAGLVPPFREAVEALFLRSLIKVVFATETLALGINMPARSVIIESLSKFTGSGHEDLTSGAYTQLTGRAGRRGIDEVGYAAVVYSPYHRFGEVASLAGSRSRPLRSAFRPTYNMVANLVRSYARDDAHRLVRSSFAQYLSEEPLTRQLDSVLDLFAERRYMDGWSLTADGQRLVAIYHDCDLLIAEAMRVGLFTGLDVAEMTAMASLFTYESRREPGPQFMPSANLQERFEALDVLGEDLRTDERRLRLPQTRGLDSGFAALSAAWVVGGDLSSILMPPRRRGDQNSVPEPLMTGGDFVRNIKQLVDLLRQISLSPGDAPFKPIAAQAAEQLVRGIVAASNGVGLGEDDEVEDDPPKLTAQPLT
jgi:ATP-dependent RNA helicase HelY